MNRRSLASRLVAASAAVTALSCVPAWASDAFPNREIRLVVPWNAGGANDIAARAISAIAAEKGVRIIVENVPGATGTIGMTKVATAPPDGYTVGMGTSSTLAVVAQGLTQLRNDQFTPIARVTVDPLILLVPAASPHRTLEEFVEHVRKSGGKVSIGSPGTHNLNHIFALMTGRAAGSELTVVPYTGGAKVITDLAGRQIDAAVLKPSESKGQIDAGMVRPLGVFAAERLKAMPELPTFRERGYDVFPYGPLVQMSYVAAPANLPEAVRAKLTAIFRDAIQSAKFRSLAEQGSAVVDDLHGEALAREIDGVQKSLNEVARKVFVAKQ